MRLRRCKLGINNVLCLHYSISVTITMIAYYMSSAHEYVAIDPAGTDSYGLTALHKFASWNKTLFIELIVSKLTAEEINAKCPEGKTALHWAVEMAAVGRYVTEFKVYMNLFILDNNKLRPELLSECIVSE